jgi:hypothetical protein
VAISRESLREHLRHVLIVLDQEELHVFAALSYHRD